MNTEKTNVPERKLRDHERLAGISTVHVAQIAATLLRDGGDEAQAIRRAYKLLDIAGHCKLSLEAEKSSLATEKSVEAGIESYLEGVKTANNEIYAALKNAPSYEFEVGPDGKKLPVPFDKGLAVLIPLPNSIRNKADERMSRFKRFVIQRLLENRPEQEEQERKFAAGDLIAKMKREGIDARFFEDALLHFHAWWQEDYRSAQSEKGKRGQDVKKSKQVKSRSDKRKGARQPLEKTRAIAKADRGGDVTTAEEVAKWFGEDRGDDLT